MAVPVVTTAAVQAVGFGAGGVAASSLAAGIQATMGGVVAKGSAFAVAQSVGATGFAATIGSMFFPVSIAGGLGYLGYKGYKYFKKRDGKDDKDDASHVMKA